MKRKKLGPSATRLLLHPGAKVNLVRNVTGRGLGPRTVIRCEHDAIVLQLPDGQVSYLTFTPGTTRYRTETGTIVVMAGDAILAEYELIIEPVPISELF